MSGFRSLYLALALAFSVPSICYASGGAQDTAAARAMATQGLDAYREGKFQEALDLLSRAQELYPAPVHVLYIARCHSQLGHPVESSEFYNRLVRERLTEDAPQAFVDAQAAAQAELPEVRAKIAYVTIQVQGAAAQDVVVLLDGKPLPVQLVGVKAPINPGTHEVLLEGDAGEPLQFSVEQAQHEEVSLVAKSKATPPRSKNVDSQEASGSRLPAYISLGVGALGIGVGAGFTVIYAVQRGKGTSAFDDYDCATGCTADEKGEVDDHDKKASSAGTIAWIGYGVGLAGVATGVTLLLLSGNKGADAKDHAHIRPYLGLSEVGFAGRF